MRVKVVPKSEVHPIAPPITLAKPAPASKPKQPQAPISPTHQVAPEEQRRRTMRWVVGLAAVIIIGGWLSIVRYEVSTHGSTGNILSDIFRSFKSLKLGGAKPSPQELEIQQYQQQVFPQFSNTNS